MAKPRPSHDRPGQTTHAGGPGKPSAVDRRRSWVVAAALVVVLAAVLGGTYALGRRGGAVGTSSGAGPSAGTSRAGGTDEASAQVDHLWLEVVGTRPHDPAAYTQGLVWHDGTLYESTGLVGESTLREVDPLSGVVRRKVDVSPDVFAEGLALVGERLVQLTWQDGLAFVYDRDTFDRVDGFTYAGQGWGLCYDGRRLVMSDGSSNLTFRDPATFEAAGGISVTLEGNPIAQLNELECVGPDVYANVYLDTNILRIDPADGTVRSVIDASILFSDPDVAAAYERDKGNVLNGIAYDPVRDLFLVTGKRWPKLFEVRFVGPATPDPNSSPGPTDAPGTPTAARPDDAFIPHALDRM